MKAIKLYLISVVTILSFMLCTSAIGGSIILDVDAPDMALVEDPQICSDMHGNVYVAWVDDRNGSKDIYFNYSRDYGRTWQSTTRRLDTGGTEPYDSINPAISCDDTGNVYVAWYEIRKGSHKIRFNYSHSYGYSWQAESRQITSASPETVPPFTWWFPHVSCDNNGRVYVAWSTEYEPGSTWPTPTGFRYSLDEGVSWHSAPGASRYTMFNHRISNMTSDEEGHVYIACTQARFHYSEVQEEGFMWLFLDKYDDVRSAGSDERGDAIDCDGNGHVYIAWAKRIAPVSPERYSHDSIFFNVSDNYMPPVMSNDFQISDVAEEGITDQDVRMASDINGNVYVTWLREDYDGPDYFIFKRSSDHGSTWTNETSLVSRGFLYNLFHQVKADDYGNVYVTTRPDGLFRSWDYGNTWLEPLDIPDPRVSCNNRGRAYAVWHGQSGEEEDNIYFLYVGKRRSIPPDPRSASPGSGKADQVIVMPGL